MDIATGDLYEDGCDRKGRPLIGIDDEGMWWGTEEAAWFLSEQAFSVQVCGWCGSTPYDGYFIGTVDEARDYCENRRIKIDHIISGDSSDDWNSPPRR